MKSTEVANNYKNDCLDIVKKYIDANCDCSHLLKDCAFITKAHFEDIVQERACTDLCGYVLCNNNLRETLKLFKSRKYYIKSNKVYDITNRKNFCSDICFQRADYLLNQLSSEPLYLRKNTNCDNAIHLYTNSTGKIGDEVHLENYITIKEVVKNLENQPVNNEAIILKETPENIRKNKIKSDKQIEKEIKAPYLKQESFNELKDHFKNLNIYEKNVDKNEQSETNVNSSVKNHNISYLLQNSNSFLSNQNLLSEIDNLSVTSSTNSKVGN